MEKEEKYFTGNGKTTGFLTTPEIQTLLQEGIEQMGLDGKKVLVLIPDSTRTCPLPMLFPMLTGLMLPRVEKLDFLIALGTHPYMKEKEIDKMLGLDTEKKRAIRQKVAIYNHEWDNPDTFKLYGTISAEEMEKISRGHIKKAVPVHMNRIVEDYDELVILGPTFPHEVVGFSGGLKYFFPGIAGNELIDAFHWLGALITCYEIIGTKDTPVRDVINKAYEYIPRPVKNINLVAQKGGLCGCYVGTAIAAWEKAADLSEKCHIIRKHRPFKTVIGVAPEMYTDIWTGGKVMYKLEPVVADGGELIIYAPHITEASCIHGHELDIIGYHVRDYFVEHMDRFQGISGSVMAHSTHVRGMGEMVDGVEKPRITVTVASRIPREKVEQLSLHHRDPDTLNLEDYRGREDEGILVVEAAGEILHRLMD